MDSDYTIKLSKQDLQTVLMAIAEIPFRIAAPLIEKINKQTLEQTSNAEQAKEEK